MSYAAEWLIVFFFVIVQIIMAGTDYKKSFLYCQTVSIVSNVLEFVLIITVMFSIFPFYGFLASIHTSKNTDSNQITLHSNHSSDKMGDSEHHSSGIVDLP